MTLENFRRHCAVLVHYAPSGFIRPERGLLTASQILDSNADEWGKVSARFLFEGDYHEFDKEHWKGRSRFVRWKSIRQSPQAEYDRDRHETGCNLLVRDKEDPSKDYFLGNNFPLSDGLCLGTNIGLTDNRAGYPQPSREDWFRLLNRMFWVFDQPSANPGFLNHLRAASKTGHLSVVRLFTCMLPDDIIKERVRMSAINGGGSNGGAPRGTATYKQVADWNVGWPPKEIGILDGLPHDTCIQLRESGALTIEEA